ncbi:MAG: efflux RND transporter periplasmic adaptor subunit, partial [Acetobacteraceae bacterium]|nr:efflux RND transporter periplasmic adaptor subunit [Acetobacteraceae bacterium]
MRRQEFRLRLCRLRGPRCAGKSLRNRPYLPLASMVLIAVLAGVTVGARAQPAPVPVEVAQVRTADVPFTLQGIGTVEAFNTVTLRARVDGALQQIRFTEGQSVRAGDVLAQIDPRPYKAALDEAVAKKTQDDARLRNAELDLQRYADLARSDFASRQQLATQQATVAQLQAQVQGDQAAIENAQTQLSYTTLTSPIDGITGIRLVDQGNLIRATDATGIVVITQIRPISVVFTLPAEDVGEIRQRMAEAPLQVTVIER